MQHLDEGTIHAWLDGALDSAQASEVEAHVAQCASCSAAVAEARGLIAASSRILTALDDVPADVIPKRVPAIPSVLKPKPARRQWRAAPWVSGIAAAALLFAIGISQVGRDSKGVAFEQAPVAAPARRASAPLADSAFAPSAPAVVPVGGTASNLDASRPTTGGGTSGAKGAGSQVSQRGTVRREDAANVAVTRPTQRFAVDTARKRELADTRDAKSVQREQLAAAPTTSAPPTAAPATAEESKLAVSKSVLPTPPALGQVVVTRAGARDMAKAEDPEVRLAGCYRVERPTGQGQDTTRLRRVGEAVASAGGAARGRAAPQAAIADRQSQYAPALPAIVRLDTTRHALGFTVRDARSDSTVGSWAVLRVDSAEVYVVATGRFTFASKDRVPCPQR